MNGDERNPFEDHLESTVHTSEQEIQTWRILRKALAQALRNRSIDIEPRNVCFVTRFMIAEIEAEGLRLVPVKPTRAMVEASLHALDKGKRLNTKWVRLQTKHRWRIVAAIEAAPKWQLGYSADRDR